MASPVFVRDPAEDGQGRAGKAVMVGDALAQLEDAQAQVVAAAVRLIVHKTVARERAQQPVGGAERQLRAARQLCRAGAPRLIAQQHQQAQGLAHHVRPGVLLGGLGRLGGTLARRSVTFSRGRVCGLIHTHTSMLPHRESYF